MLCNAQKSVAMIFNPRNRNTSLDTAFPNFTLGSCELQFVSEFKYLGHIIANDLCDKNDI